MLGTVTRSAMTALTLPDLAALVWFIGAWIIYSIVIEKSEKSRSSLNAFMNDYRDEWMERLLERDMRMVDAQVTAALQNGAAFFASTTPPSEERERDTPAAQAIAHRAFLGPVPFALSTAGILIVLWQRQFSSEARKHLTFRPTRRSPSRSGLRLSHRHQNGDPPNDQHRQRRRESRNEPFAQFALLFNAANIVGRSRRCGSPQIQWHGRPIV